MFYLSIFVKNVFEYFLYIMSLIYVLHTEVSLFQVNIAILYPLKTPGNL